MVASDDARPSSPRASSSVQESDEFEKLNREIEKRKREVRINTLREELNQLVLLRQIKVGLAAFVAAFLFVLVYLLIRETPDSRYLVQALGVKILGALLAIGIISVVYYRLCADDD